MAAATSTPSLRSRWSAMCHRDQAAERDADHALSAEAGVRRARCFIEASHEHRPGAHECRVEASALHRGHRHRTLAPIKARVDLGQEAQPVGAAGIGTTDLAKEWASGIAILGPQCPDAAIRGLGDAARPMRTEPTPFQRTVLLGVTDVSRGRRALQAVQSSSPSAPLLHRRMPQGP